MKKHLKKLFILFTFVVLMTACGDKKTDGTSTEITTESAAENAETTTAEPLVIVDSPEAFLDMGIFIDAPIEAEDKTYSILNGNMAEINFVYESSQYVLRGTKTKDQLDFDMNDDYDELEDVIDNGTRQASVKTTVGGCHACFWTYEDVNYVLMSRQPVTKEDFTKLAMWLAFPD